MLLFLLKSYVVLGLAWAAICIFMMCRDLSRILKGRDVTVYGASVEAAKEGADDVMAIAKMLHDIPKAIPPAVVSAVMALVVTCACAYAGLTWPKRIYEVLHERFPAIAKGIK